MRLSFAAAALAALALASCGSSQPLIGTGACNGHACSPAASTGASSTGSATKPAVSSEVAIVSVVPTPAPAPSVSGEAAVPASRPSVPQGIAVGEPNPSAPVAAATGEIRGTDLPLPATPEGAVNGYEKDAATGWWLPVATPDFRAQKLDAPLTTPDEITARINAQGGWRYWHTLRKLPDGTTYFFVVGPTDKPDEAGWYANFQIPAVDGSGAWLATVLLETTPAQPKAFAGLADMYKGIVKKSGIPVDAPHDLFKAAADGFTARKAQAPAK